MSVTRSGLQKDVLQLYRRALKMVRTKPVPIQPKFRLLVRYNFRKSASSVSPRDITAIEHLLRAGKKQIEMYEDPSVKDCWISADIREWANDEKTRNKGN